jgi:1,6-anhydro-N-acetylmuramate kinase
MRKENQIKKHSTLNTQNSALIIGLMSGTSHDGVDAALVEITPVRGQDSGVWIKQ